MVVTAIAAFAWIDRPVVEKLGGSGLDPRHVAVRFFQDLTPDSSLRWLAQGITRELMHELSSLDTLRVVSASRLESFRDPALTGDSVARALGVGTLIEGTVRVKRATQVEVLVQLIDASNGYRVKSWSFEQPLTEAMSMVDELNFAIVSYLREHVGAAIGDYDRRSEARDIAVWRAVQDAEDLFAEGTRLSRIGRSQPAWTILERADSLLVVVARREPSWAAPWLLRARVARAAFLALSLRERVGGQKEGSAGLIEVGLATLARGQDYARHAELLDSTLVDARSLLAYFHYLRWQISGQAQRSADLDSAEVMAHRVVREHRSQALAWFVISRIHRYRGQSASADSAAERAYHSDPFLQEARRVIADMIERRLETGRTKDAIDLCSAARTRYLDDKEVPECHLAILGWTATSRDSIAAAWREIAMIENGQVLSVAAGRTMRRMYAAAIAARAGLSDSARAIIATAYATRGANRADSTRSAIAEAWVHLLLKDRAAAVRVLDSLLKSQPAQWPAVSRYPWFASLRRDSAFLAPLRDCVLNNTTCEAR